MKQAKKYMLRGFKKKESGLTTGIQKDSGLGISK